MSEFCSIVYYDVSEQSDITLDNHLPEQHEFSVESCVSPPVLLCQPQTQTNVNSFEEEIEEHCDAPALSLQLQIGEDETQERENCHNSSKTGDLNHQPEELVESHAGGDDEMIIVPEEVDNTPDAITITDKDNIMSQPENEIKVAPSEAMDWTPNDGNNVSFLSACAHILFTGRDSVQLLSCVLRHFKEKTGNYCFPIITVKNESVMSLQGIPLHAHINATIIDACPPTPVFILILENFPDDKICDLYKSGFVWELLQAPYRRAHVIFLSPFSVKNVDKIVKFGPMVVQADFAHWMITSRTTAFEDDEPIVSEIDRDDHEYTTSGTIKIQDKKEKDNNVNVDTTVEKMGMMEDSLYANSPVVCQPVSNFGDKAHIQLLHSTKGKDFMEMKTLLNVSPSSNADVLDTGSLNNPQKVPEKEMGGALQERVTDKCIGCFHGIFNAICTILAQCGDCCFY